MTEIATFSGQIRTQPFNKGQKLSFLLNHPRLPNTVSVEVFGRLGSFQEKPVLPKLGSTCLPVLLRLGSLGPEVLEMADGLSRGTHVHIQAKQSF